MRSTTSNRRSITLSVPIEKEVRVEPGQFDAMTKQEAQLSQRDRAKLRVIEYFVKSLKVIRSDTAEYTACVSLY